MHPADLAILLHRALEVRLARLQELLGPAHWAEGMEQLHQVRVAARRLGAVLDLVDPEVYPGHKGQRRALKGLVDILGLPRELDVHADRLLAHHLEVRTTTQAAVIEHLLEQVDRGRAWVWYQILKSWSAGSNHTPSLNAIVQAEDPLPSQGLSGCKTGFAAWYTGR